MEEKISRSLERALKAYHAISTPQRYQLLTSLYSGDYQASIDSVRDAFGLPNSTIFYYLTDFTECGLIRRERPNSKRRGRLPYHYTGTDYGRRLLQLTEEFVNAEKNELISNVMAKAEGLSEEEKQKFEEILRKAL
jgi:predicted transcriptional regulator